MTHLTRITIILLTLLLSFSAHAEKYKIDNFGAHAFIQFKIQHLGYSWLLGRFNHFEGEFDYTATQPQAASIRISIDTSSLDSNHGLRDKHLRSKDFLDVKTYPKATFVSTSFTEDGQSIIVKGKFTLRGITKDIVIKGKHIGAGDDPWGMYRRGFEGSTSLLLRDYAIPTDLGPASQEVQLYFSFEGIRLK